MDEYVLKQNTLVIRRTSGDRIVALVEIVSPGNKASRQALRRFVEKAAAALWRGYHLLVLDLHPPGPRDPEGIHGAICAAGGDLPRRLAERAAALAPCPGTAGGRDVASSVCPGLSWASFCAASLRSSS
jgi:hypothetical protein